jgi:hypothetical protein
MLFFADATGGGYMAGFWSAFKLFSKGMTAGDAYFHLLLAGCVVGGTLLAQGVGASLWQSHNSGVCSMQMLLRACKFAMNAGKRLLHAI